MRYDHAIIGVMDLKAASADFEGIGFNVIPGGTHSGGLTHNTLIVFADGSYLELMAPTDPKLLEDPPKPGPGNYLFLFEAGEGFIASALHTNHLDEVVAGVRARGLEIGDPQPGGRKKEDGTELAWRGAFLPGSTSLFFLTDDTPREYRVPNDPASIKHPNGALGVVRTVDLVTNIKAGSERFSAILGLEPTEGAPLEGAETAEFEIEGFRMTIAAPRQEGGVLLSELGKRGEGLFQIEIATELPEHAGEYDPHNAHLVLRHRRLK